MLGERERAVVLAVLAGVVAMVAVWGHAPEADSDTMGATKAARTSASRSANGARPSASSGQDQSSDSRGHQGSGTNDPAGPETSSPDAQDPTSTAAPSSTPTPSAPQDPTAPTTSPTTAAPTSSAGTISSADLRGDCPEPVPGLHDSAPGSAPVVALTFDDGPSPYTSQILDVLADKKVPATFFVTGQHVRQHPELVARTTREGHLVGNHTWDHVYPQDVEGGWSVPYLKRQLSRTSNAIVEAGGDRTCWFRPPGGDNPPALQPVAQALKMSIALWSVDTKDWKIQSNGDAPGLSWKIYTAALTTTQQHPIILMHDGGGFRGATAAALPKIIDWYQERGYTFVRLDGRS